MLHKLRKGDIQRVVVPQQITTDWRDRTESAGDTLCNNRATTNEGNDIAPQAPTGTGGLIPGQVFLRNGMNKAPTSGIF
ncbi:hypothetical protein KCP77_23270 [Salmonella enterica subsp. enterica]|nr:hypothetical protein KCP77_23270 [Salmonella enterica subsp. enterica]